MLHQPFPTTDPLCRHLDLSRARLAQMIQDGSGPVYAYVMSSVVLDGGNLLQRGTGPNFQGGYITLCTCKHRMRTTLPADQWPGIWVAGFTSVEADSETFGWQMAAEVQRRGLACQPSRKHLNQPYQQHISRENQQRRHDDAPRRRPAYAFGAAGGGHAEVAAGDADQVAEADGL
jgi:hypothetical protein